MTRATVFLAAGLCLAATLPAGEEAGGAANFHLYSWQYSRERKTITGSNRVTGELMFKNLTGKDLADINLSITYKSGLGEPATDAVKQKITAIKADEAQKVKFVAEFIPIFSGYDIEIEYAGGKKEIWFANSDVGQPMPRNAEPIQGIASIVVLGKEATADRQGRFSGQVRVKNEGTAMAKNLKVSLTFYDVKKKMMGEWSGKLGEGFLAGGAEENLPFVMPVAPKNYAAYELKATCDDTSAETALSGGDFTNAAEVEFAKFSFVRSDPKAKELKVSAQVRNGLATAVAAVKLTLTFMGPARKEIQRFTYEVPGQLKPGEIKPFAFAIPSLPAYEAFEQEIAYDSAGAAPDATAEAPKPKAEKAKFKNIADVEVIFLEAVTNDDKSVSLVGSMRNGKNVPVKDTEITVSFAMPGTEEPLKAVKTLSDVVKPGEERNFVMKADDAAGFKKYGYTFKFTPAAP